MICAPPSTPCWPANRCPKNKSPASVAISNGNPATPRITFDGSFRHQGHVHGLQPDFSGTREAVPENLAGPGKKALRQPLKNCIHDHRTVLVNPAAGFNVNLFAGLKFHFEDITVAVQP